MSYLAPIHKPTSIKHALKIRLFEHGHQCLVLAKADRLEIYSESQEGLSLIYSRNVYGKVKFLERLQVSPTGPDQLFVGTDRYVYFTVRWDDQSHQLRTEKSYVDQSDSTSRESHSQNVCQIDPSNSYLALLLFDGIVTILPTTQRSRKKSQPDIPGLGDPVLARISDLFIRSFVFLHAKPKDRRMHKIAFLYEDNHQKVCLSVRALDYSAGVSGDPGSADLENVLLCRDDIELGASHLIAVPAPAYGFLVLCEASICYVGDIDGDIVSKPLDQPAQFVAWTPIDGQRWLIADDYGNLYLLMLLLEDGETVVDWNIDLIGKSSQASCLVYLDGGRVFVGSHQGDSQVVKVTEAGLEVVQTISNIAPVLDFTIMDMGSRADEGQTNEYSSGQARIVTGSGAFQDGSLRSVRSGVGIEEQGLLGEMKHATEVFAVRSSPSISQHDVLIVSFVNETRVFLFHGDGEVAEQTKLLGLTMSEETLLACASVNDSVLQVTGSISKLIDLESSTVIADWAPSQNHTITAATANESDLALSIGGIEAVLLDLNDQLKVKARRTFSDEGQIACLHVPPGVLNICIIGFWQSSSIALLRCDTLETVAKVAVSDDAVTVPRSILLASILADQSPTLFVAMANGDVVTFSLNTSKLDLTSKKIMVLGTQPASFKALPRNDGLANVFAMCEHPSLIYGSEGRIVYSAVTAERATSICSFDSAVYPSAIAIATPEDVRIAVVDTERTTHVQTLPVGETVRRIAYSPRLKAFGIGTIHRELRGTQEVVKSNFRLADEVLFKALDTYELNEEELVESVARADLREDSGEVNERFIVGTAYLEDNQGESIRGRILVFAVSIDRHLKLITELPVKGACRALSSINGHIVAALVKTVVLYALRASHLQKLCTYRTSTAPIDIAVHTPTSQICIADLMKSISVITYTPASASHPEDTLTETSRHFQTAWATACAHVDTDTWLEADAEGNLMVLKQNTVGVTADDKRRLEVVSEIRLGEMVNRIRSVNVDASASAPVVPKAFMATVDGGVYLFGQIAPRWLDLLMRLQSALAARVVSLGDIPFNTYRAFKNQVRSAEEPYRFVDGQLVEAFLNLDASMQEAVVDEVGEVAAQAGGVEGIKELVESLRRLH